MKIFLLLVFLVSCRATIPIYSHNALIDQILKVRAAYPGMLTNSACLEYKNGKCVSLDIIQYSLNDPEMRYKLIDLGFKCQVGGKRFRICRDRPGFCRWENKCLSHPWYWPWVCSAYEETYVPASNHQFLIDSKTYCKKN